MNLTIMKHDVFISYSSQNKDAADAICHAIEENGIRCWMAPRDLPPGSQYGDVIDDAIKSSKVVVVVFSEKAAESPWVNGELNVAFEDGKTIIPFRLDKTPLKGSARVMLNQRHWIDAYPDFKVKFKDLVMAVSHAIGKPVSDAEPVKPDEPRKSVALGKKQIIWIAAAVVLLALGIFLYPKLANKFQTYIYDGQGLHVKTEGLSDNQQNALTSILDGMVLVEGGTFTMGNTEAMSDFLIEQDSLSRNPHEVKLDNYYICKYEVTQSQWKAFLSADGRCLKEGDDEAAIDQLSWEDAKAFADTLSSITGLAFSLPTEAQWEYAAKGGKKSEGYIYSGADDDPTDVGWTSVDELSSAHAVGVKRANEIGLYDMTGNVSEWCLDYYAPYTSDSQTNPAGPSEGMDRVLRGGDFTIESLLYLKTTTRYHDAPFVNRRAAGMRLVINLSND